MVLVADLLLYPHPGTTPVECGFTADKKGANERHKTPAELVTLRLLGTKSHSDTSRIEEESRKKEM